jgi:4-hydroxythreonine-4-phosphate dehydrogenase
LGDPAGIGPEIVRKALAHRHLHTAVNILLIGSFADAKRVPTGKPSVLGGRLSGEYIKKAVELAQAGLVDAIVTAPINKVSFRMGGWGKKFVGHTEMLAALTKTNTVRSMLVCDTVRAVHVTSHIPLRQVADSLSIRTVSETIKLAVAGLKQLGISNPKVGVAGLNPHAGDNGILGMEERKIILPAINVCRRAGCNVEGPISADVLWPLVKEKIYDAGVAMYHDQGQIAVKLAGFTMGKNQRLDVRGTQITLGLPFVRVSVDHGTAYDIAGKGVASEESLLEAIRTALHMVKKNA